MQLTPAKSQLISKCLFGIFNSPKKRTKKFDFTKYYGTSTRIVFVHFLGELKTSKIHFEINWPLVWTWIYLLAWSQCHKSLSLQSHCHGFPSIRRLLRWCRLRNGLTPSLLKLLLFKCRTSRFAPIIQEKKINDLIITMK
jgi:hypothetical protein